MLPRYILLLCLCVAVYTTTVQARAQPPQDVDIPKPGPGEEEVEIIVEGGALGSVIKLSKPWLIKLGKKLMYAIGIEIATECIPEIIKGCTFTWRDMIGGFLIYDIGVCLHEGYKNEGTICGKNVGK
ncbi:hypothetical protein TKK_0009185 [Trichogramma kaykai]